MSINLIHVRKSRRSGYAVGLREECGAEFDGLAKAAHGQADKAAFFLLSCVEEVHEEWEFYGVSASISE